jgi:hypothetical protein
MEDGAVPPLLKAAKSRDEEVRRRAAKILDTLSKRLKKWSLPKSLADIEREGLSRFVKRMVDEDGFADKEGWAKLRLLTSRVAGWAGVQFQLSYPDGTLGLTFQDLKPAELTTRHDCPKSGCRRSKILVQGLGHPVEELDHCILISTGPLRQPIHSIKDSVVIVDGDFSGCKKVRSSLVVSRGKMGSFGSVKGSTVICADSINLIHELDNSVLVSLGNVSRVKQTLRNAVLIHMGDGGLEHWPVFSESSIHIGVLTSPIQLFQSSNGRAPQKKDARQSGGCS